MPSPTAKRAAIAGLILGMLIYSLGMGVTYPLLGVVLAEHTSGAWNGVNAAATGLGLLLGVAAAPGVSRRIGAGSTVLAGVLLMAASLVAIAVIVAAPSPDFWALFFFRMTLGCGANLMFVIAETALNVFADPARRGRVMGVYSAAVSVGFVIGPSVIAVAALAPTPLLLLCALVTAVAALPISCARAPVSAGVEPATAAGLPRAVAAEPLAFAFLVVASAVDAVAISLLPVIAVAQQFSTEQGALFVAVFHFGLLLGQPLIGLSLDRFGRRRTVLGCAGGSFLGAAAMIFGARFGFEAACAVMLVWGGVNYGLYTAGLAVIGDRFRGAALSAAVAAFAGVYALVSLSAPVLAGLGLEAMGAGVVYFVAAAVYLAALAVGWRAFHPNEPSSPGRGGCGDAAAP